MTMRTVCPRCLAGLVVDRVYSHQDVTCGSCGHVCVAEPAGPFRRRPSRFEDEPDDRPRRRRPRPDESNWAIGSFLLGIISSVIFCLWPVGLMVSVAGLVTGARGLRSRSRNLAIVGLVFSVVGLIFAAGIGVTMVVAIVASSGSPDPNPPPRLGGR